VNVSVGEKICKNIIINNKSQKYFTDNRLSITIARHDSARRKEQRRSAVVCAAEDQITFLKSK
jgi:hypothetical protein